MKSCIYVGQVRHRRLSPVKHSFQYPLFMMYLDLDELPDIFQKYWFWSYQKKNIASFQRKDYMGDKSVDLSEAVRDLVKQKTGELPAGPVRLLTHMKYFSHVFNPVSFYYCYESDGQTLHRSPSRPHWFQSTFEHSIDSDQAKSGTVTGA